MSKRIYRPPSRREIEKIIPVFMLDTVNKISASDRAVGWMALQIYKCAEEQKWYPALASLFLLAEQVVRWASDANIKETFYHIINRALEEKLITQSEAQMLHKMREYRNGYLHADFHASAFEIGGLMYQVNDEETAGALFGMLAPSCFNLIYKLTTSVFGSFADLQNGENINCL